jgi:hypothetical protein
MFGGEISVATACAIKWSKGFHWLRVATLSDTGMQGREVDGQQKDTKSMVLMLNGGRKGARLLSGPQ